MFLALRPRFGLIVIAQGQGFGSRGSIWADFEIFEIMGGAGDIYNSISMTNYWDEPYSDLGICVNTVLSAWTEVWTATCCPKPAKSSIFCCEFWPLKYQPHSLVKIPTKADEISYFNTDTTHKHWLDTIQHERKWSWHWVSQCSFHYKPWFFVEVDGHRDFQKNDKIFVSVCLYYLPHQYQTHMTIVPIARGYEKTLFYTLSMQ